MIKFLVNLKINNLVKTLRLLPSKDEIHFHKGFETVCLIEWNREN